MKKHLLTSFGIIILMISCNKTEAEKIKESDTKKIEATELRIEKENQTTENTYKTEPKREYYNLTSNIKFIHNGKSEIGKINDSDGFSNLRKEANSKSGILSKITENEYFFYQPNKQSNWVKVKDLKGNIGFIHKSRILKITDNNLYNMSFTDYDNKTKTEFRKDTIVNFDFLEKFFLDNYFENKFNYRKLNPIKKSISHKDSLVIYKDKETSISLSKSKFIPKDHKIEYSGRYVKKIDNKEFWGTDGGIPKYKFESIIITESGISYSIPKSKLNDLFGPNLEPNSLQITKPNDNRLIIKMANSDGAGAYAVIFILKENKLLDRFVYQNF